MKHLDLSEINVTYTSATTGKSINVNTTNVVIPDPHHRYDVSMGSEHISFTAGDVFEALARLLEVTA